MKKLIISSVLGVVVAASTAFGQGYVAFGGGSRVVWDDTGTVSANPATESDFDATFLWAASTTTSAAIDAIAASSPTNGTLSYAYSAAWADIENTAGGWNVAASGGAAMIGAPASANGSFTYNSGGAVPLDNAGASGTIDSFYVIAWNTEGGTLTTLAAAEAANAPVGWSAVFSYTLGSAPPATPPPVTGEGKFGVGVAPEPTTLALAGLGGLSMLFLRRKKA